MSSCSLPVVSPVRFARSAAIAALMGATLLAGSLSAANAAVVAPAPVQLAQATAPQTPAAPAAPAASQTQAAPQDKAAANAEAKAETVEQRITDLHTALQITPQ